eukprot:gene51439-62905_t
MKLKITAVAALAVLAGAASAQDVQVVKIGHVAPMSGAQAHYGKDNENGARMAIEELNTQNISIGGKKVKLELLSEDDGADPQKATLAAQKLVDAKVNGVVGHLNSGASLPASWSWTWIIGLISSRTQSNTRRPSRRVMSTAPPTLALPISLRPASRVQPPVASRRSRSRAPARVCLTCPLTLALPRRAEAASSVQPPP